MAVRTTDAAVKGIIEVDATISTTPFIEAASAIVDDECVDSGYDSTRLELIERWLSAHFYAIRDKQVSSEKAGSVGEVFQFKLGLNLAVTMYGQMAMQVDTQGNLANLSKRTEKGFSSGAKVVWLGTEPPT